MVSEQAHLSEFLGTPKVTLSAAHVSEAVNSVSWWHRISIDEKVTTPGMQDLREVIPNYLLDKINFKGKSVLGYGCRDGVQLFWAEAHGAQRAVFFEDTNQDKAQNASAHLLAQWIDSRVEFAPQQLSSLGTNQIGKFDIVLAYDSINSETDPLRLIETLCESAKEELILSCHIQEENDAPPASLLYRSAQADGTFKIFHAPNFAWLEVALRRSAFSIAEFKIWQTDKVRHRITLRAIRNKKAPVQASSLQSMPTDIGQEKDTTVLVMSCARFQQVWNPFFKLFSKYWADCPYQVKLCTDKGSYPGVTCIEVGEDKGWSSNCLHALRQIESDYVILFQEDFLLTAPVQTETVRKLVKHARDYGVGCMRLFACPGPTEKWDACDALGSLTPLDTYRLSLQLAVWNRKLLMELLKEGETPWQTELVGTTRAAQRPEPFLSVQPSVQPVPYFCTAVVKGEWQDEALELLKKENISTVGITKCIPTNSSSMPQPPPLTVPPELLNAFTLNGRIPVREWYIDQSSGGPDAQVYATKEIDLLIEKARRRENNYYERTDQYLFAALDQFPIQNKTCVIMGSQVPWYESIAISRGVSRCVVVEYQTIPCTDPRIEFLTPQQYQQTPFLADIAFSISSFEHDGLGRYGDPINPVADIEAMSKVNAMLKPGGLLFVAVPVGKDKLVWNAHRIYGSVRLPLLFQGWKILGAFGYSDEILEIDTGTSGGTQPVFVLQKQM